MRPIATHVVRPVVYVFVCVLGTPVNHAKTDETIEMPLVEEDSYGPKEQLLHISACNANITEPLNDSCTAAMRPYIKSL